LTFLFVASNVTAILSLPSMLKEPIAAFNSRVPSFMVSCTVLVIVTLLEVPVVAPTVVV
jgi:hypothetical protein